MDRRPQDHEGDLLTPAVPHTRDPRGLSAFSARKLNASGRVATAGLEPGRLNRLPIVMGSGQSLQAYRGQRHHADASTSVIGITGVGAVSECLDGAVGLQAARRAWLGTFSTVFARSADGIRNVVVGAAS